MLDDRLDKKMETVSAAMGVLAVACDDEFESLEKRIESEKKKRETAGDKIRVEMAELCDSIQKDSSIRQTIASTSVARALAPSQAFLVSLHLTCRGCAFADHLFHSLSPCTASRDLRAAVASQPCSIQPGELFSYHKQ